MKLLFTIVLLVLALTSNAHDYYFAFAEMQFNKERNRLEISIRVTGHDLEDYMKHIGQKIPKMEKCINNPLEQQKLTQVITKHFKVIKEGKPLSLNLIGMEVNNKDEAIFYLVSKDDLSLDEVSIQFDILMDYFEEQQNKLTLFSENGKEFLTFLPHQRIRKLSIN